MGTFNVHKKEGMFFPLMNSQVASCNLANIAKQIKRNVV